MAGGVTPVKTERSEASASAISGRSIRGRIVLTALAAGALVVLGVLGVASFYGAKTIHDLLGENKVLKRAIENLTAEDQIGYAKVLSQEERNGRLMTRLLFVETSRDDPLDRILEKEYEIEGDVIFFDALIVKFGAEVVADGRERALYLWRRIYGETMSPASGFALEDPGVEPARYAELCAKLSLKHRRMFWSEIWELSDDPGRLSKSGVKAIYGNVVYKKIRPGFIYIFKIDATGSVYPEVVPDL